VAEKNLHVTVGRHHFMSLLFMIEVTNAYRCYFGNCHIFLQNFLDCTFLFYYQIVNSTIML
jgi:hypothetical protein